MRVLSVIHDRKGRAWLYQFGHFYASHDGRVLRHRDDIRRGAS